MLVKVDAAGINRADLLQAAGKYPPPPGASEILGIEVSGTVAEVGEQVDRVGRSGNRSALCWPAAGTPSTSRCPAGQVMPVPDTVELAPGRRTARGGVHGVVQPGDDRGPGGRAGGADPRRRQRYRHARASRWRGRWTAGSRSPPVRRRKLDLCSELGADIVINYRDEDFVERVREATDGAGADVILDIMGAAYLDRNIDALAIDGRLVVIGMQGGVKAELNIGKLIGKRAGVIGTTLRGAARRTAPAARARSSHEVVDNVWPMIADGRVRPIVGAEFPIEQAAAAHELLDVRRGGRAKCFCDVAN